MVIVMTNVASQGCTKQFVIKGSEQRKEMVRTSIKVEDLLCS